MAYNKVGWKNWPLKLTMISAENLDHMDEQIKVNADNIGDIEKISEIGDGTLAGAMSVIKEQVDKQNSDLGLKQDAATAITTSNIAIQSVNYADSAGNASKLGGNAASAFSAANHNHNTAYLAISEWGRASGKLLQTYNHTIGSYSIKGGDKVDISSKNLAISGYTSLGIVGYECSDKRLGVTHCALTDAGVFSGTLRNFASSEYNGTLYVKVLYIKNI